MATKAKRKVVQKKKASRKAPAPKAAVKKKPVAPKKEKEQPAKPDTLLGKGPVVPEPDTTLPENKEPWMSNHYNPEHDALTCVYCEGTIHVTETPVVLEWGKKTGKNIPQWMGRPVKKAAHYKCDREERERKGLVKRKKEQPTAAGTPVQTGKAPKATGDKQKAPRAKGNDLQRIYRISKENPRKAGTHGWNSFNLIKDGMTVTDYLAAGGRRNDLGWDVDHNYVELRDK